MTVSQTDYERTVAHSDPILQMRDTTVSFDMERGESRVLDNVDMDVERNEVLGVVGESGSGKSMFASALLDAVVDPGYLRGDITYNPGDGESLDVLELSKRERKQYRWEEVSMVFQGAMSSFNPVRDIETHFVETLEAHDYDVREGMQRARQLLSDLYLDPDRVLDSYPHELSGGMKQRALIALSLILEPEVLVMDEPTAALDLLMQRSIISLLENLKERYDLTIVFITHDLPLVADIADRVGVLYAFEFVELGPTEEILEDAAHPYTRMLLKSTPNLESPIENMRPVEGSAPDPVNVPEGCSFHPRCPMADEQCIDDDPGPYDAGEGRFVHCHYWEQSSEEIPMAADDTPDEQRAAEFAEAEEVRENRERGEPVLSMNDVEVHFEKESGFLDFFEDPPAVKAVDGIDLDIYENDVVVLVGESGCGKTTLGKTAVGLQRPTGGSVEYRGDDIWDVRDGEGDGSVSWGEIRRSLQIVHQDPGSALNPHRRNSKILEAPLKRWHQELDGNDRRQRVMSMLEHVGMTPPEDYYERYPHQLSGGEQQRVALIRAMLMNPEVIMADEPVSALDVSLRVEMMDLLIELQEMFDTSYLFISHDLANARYIAERTGGRIGVLYLGELVEVGPPEQVINDPQHPYTQALRWATPELDPAEERAEESPIREIDIPDPTNPPSGCRYHTRCPEAREVCTEQTPGSYAADTDSPSHRGKCFRMVEDHEYWRSESIVDEDETDFDAGADDSAGAASSDD